MLLNRWPILLVLLVIGLNHSGCSILAKKTANQQNGQSSAWNPFSKPNVTYAEQSESIEEEFPAKKITDPNPLKLRYAMWMEETGNLSEAQLHYTAVLAAQPQNLEAVLGVARINLSSGQVEQAEQGFRRALMIDPASASAQGGLGQCLVARKQWPEAVAALSVATRGLPEDKTVHYQLAVALAYTGDLAQAQTQFSHCVKESAGHYNIALILKDQGQLSAAEAQLELALRQDPNFKDAERWLTEIRKVLASASQVSLSGPPEIQPVIKQVTYKEYELTGTETIEPAVYIAESSPPTAQQASGHSAAGTKTRP